MTVAVNMCIYFTFKNKRAMPTTLHKIYTKCLRQRMPQYLWYVREKKVLRQATKRKILSSKDIAKTT